ncbi:MAG: germination protein YpeB [Clostridia bacterium]|nr:germination protein YpeB [Clostridia bacterium]
MNESFFAENARTRDWPRILNIALAALLAGVLAFSAAQTARLNEANARNNAVVQKAFYETCELTEGMAVNFRKLLVAGETGQIQALLNETALQTQGALSNLALLPLGQETVSATLKFINQAGDFAGTLSVKLGNGGGISREDYDTLEDLSETAAAFSVSMGRLLERYERGEAVFDASDYDETGAESLYPITNPAAEYPALLYDGPFSDGRADGDFKGLEGLAAVDETQARQALIAFLGSQQLSEVTFTGESAIPVDCYEYAVSLGGYRLTAGVTRLGGQVLYMLSDGAVGEVNLTDRQAVDAARAFLLARGYGEMEMSYSSRFEGILTVNFASVQNGVVLYPDLVKVQVSLADGAIIGLEAAGYLMNHVARTLEIPALSEQDAVDRIGGALTPQSARLCLIPDNAGEFLCYEVRATSGRDTFLVYIDAVTGIERKLMQVISDENGALVM